MINMNLRTYNKNYDKFLTDFFKILDKNNSKVTLSTTDHVIDPDSMDDNACNGWIIEEDDGTFDFACAIGKGFDVWGPTLVHESCHIDQALDDRKGKLKVKDNTSKESGDMWVWLSGKKVKRTKEEIDFFIQRAMMIELDNERRTIKKMKKYKLPFDTKLYAQRANAYILFYKFIATHRCWYKPSKEPYVMEEILNIMPTKIGPNKNYDWNKPLPKGLEELYKECCK